MSPDSRAFRRALGTFPTGVAVVTAAMDSAKPMGITVNSFASVSLNPQLVLWCLNRASDRFAVFSAAQSYVINVLGAVHESVSARLARPGAHVLDGLALKPTELGPPALADALAVFECVREAVYDGGDHAILVGRVMRFSCRNDGEPLVFYRGRYGALPE